MGGKEVLIGDGNSTIRHSIPIPSGSPQDTNTPQPPSGRQSLLLCKGSDRRPLWGASTFIPIARIPMFLSTLIRLFGRSLQPHLDHMKHVAIHDPTSYRL